MVICGHSEAGVISRPRDAERSCQYEVRPLGIVILLILAALGAWVTWSREKERSAEFLRRERALAPRPDVSDPVFRSTISPTKDPLVFKVEVKKVNPKSDKQFSALFISMALVLTDKNGKVYGAAGFGAGKVLRGSGRFPLAQEPDRRFGYELSTGREEQPASRNLYGHTFCANHGGREACLRGPYADGGVSVPAAKFATITIK